MSFLRAFLVSVLGTGLSRVLGLIRDIVINTLLGAGAANDTFQIAWTVPGLFRKFVADEGLTGALVPAVARAEAEEDTEVAQHLAGQVLGGLLLLNAGILALTMAMPEFTVWLLASGFSSDPEKFAITAEMTRWLMPFVWMVSLVSFFEGLLNYRGHFFVPKIAPGIVSAGICAGVFLFGTAFEEPAWSIVVGVWIGGIVHVLVHLPLVHAKWGPVRLTFSWNDPRFRDVFSEMLKVIGIGVFGQLNIIVLRQLSSYLADGAISRWSTSTRMIDLTQGVIAVAIGGALLPAIAKAVHTEAWDRFKVEVVGALRLAAFILLPSAVGLFVYAVPLTSILFLRGKFTWDDVLWTASAIQLLVPFMLAVAGVSILKRIFFALDRRNFVLVVGALGVGFTGFVGWLALDYDILGLAVALSFATTVQLVFYVVALKRVLGENFPVGALVLPLSKMALATVPVFGIAFAAASKGAWHHGSSLANLGWFATGIAGAAVLYGLTCWLLGVEELTKVVDRIRGRLAR